MSFRVAGNRRWMRPQRFEDNLPSIDQFNATISYASGSIPVTNLRWYVSVFSVSLLIEPRSPH
jgi:hypothetical protein